MWLQRSNSEEEIIMKSKGPPSTSVLLVLLLRKKTLFFNFFMSITSNQILNIILFIDINLRSAYGLSIMRVENLFQ